MKQIDSVSADLQQIQIIAQIVKSLTLKNDFLLRPFLSLEVEAEIKARMLFFSVGICHQTYALADKNRNLFGWDYLEDGFIRIASCNSVLLDPVWMEDNSIPTISDHIRPFFSPTGNPEDCTLDRLDERAGLWKNMAVVLNRDFKSSVLYLIAMANNHVNADDKGFYHLLPGFGAYTDPLFKKASFLIKLLGDAGFVTLKDPENLVPVMDYHMQRVLLRTGCVVINNPELETELKSRYPTASEPVIREKCIQAMRMISDYSEVELLRMNDIFYMLGRSCCLDNPLCVSGFCDKKPCSLTRTVELLNHESCIFTKGCAAVRDSSFLKYWHPVTDTHYY